MNYGVLSLAAGGFLLGGAYSIARLTDGDGRRGIGQFVVAVGLVAAAGYFIATGVLALTAD